MAFSFTQYVGDGVTTQFAIPCPYINPSDIGVKVNGVVTAYTFASSTLVQVSPAPASGAIVEVRRTTNKSSNNVVFQDGSVLGKLDLNNDGTQFLYITQEAFDTAANSLQLNASNQFDATSHNIINALDPVNPQDVATKHYVDTIMVAAGNVPNPGASTGGLGWFLKSLSSSTWGWAQLLADNLTDFVQKANGSVNGDHIRLKTDKSGYEFRTPTQVVSDLGLVIGTNTQAHNARLDDVAGAAWAQGDVMYFNGTNLVRLGAGTSGQALITKGAAANPVFGNSPAIIGHVRNLVGTRPSNTTLNFVFDEATVSTALGGVHYTSGAQNLTLNAATTGANGMDTGTQPTSGFLSVYLIYNPTTNTFALLGTIASQTSVYGGVNMPAGYTASALIGIWPCGAGPAFVIGTQQERHFFYQTPVAIANNVTPPSSLTSQNCSAALPAAAKTADGMSGSTGANSSWDAVAADSVGTGISQGISGASASFLFGFAGGRTWTGVPIATAQTLFWADNLGTATGRLVISGFTF